MLLPGRRIASDRAGRLATVHFGTSEVDVPREDGNRSPSSTFSTSESISGWQALAADVINEASSLHNPTRSQMVQTAVHEDLIKDAMRVHHLWSSLALPGQTSLRSVLQRFRKPREFFLCCYLLELFQVWDLPSRTFSSDASGAERLQAELFTPTQTTAITMSHKSR